MTELNERPPILVQNFHTNDLDDLFQNVFRTTLASQGLYLVRKADWHSEKAFDAATAGEYVQPEDEVLADMRDDCDLNLVLNRKGNLILLFACAKFRAVTLLVAGRDAQSVEACIAEHRRRLIGRRLDRLSEGRQSELRLAAVRNMIAAGDANGCHLRRLTLTVFALRARPPLPTERG